MTSRLHDYRQAIATTIKAAMPELKTCSALSSAFSLGEVATKSFRAPGVFVVLTRSPLDRETNGGLRAQANVAIFCVADDGNAEKREAKTFVMAEAVARLAGVGQLWGMTLVGPVEALDFEQIHAEALDRKNIACVVVTFRQRVSGIAASLFNDEQQVPTELYVNGELVDAVTPEAGDGE